MDTKVRKLASIVNVLGLSSILLGSQAMAQAPVTNGVGTIVPQKDILTGQIKQNMFTADKLLAQGKYSDAEDLFRQMLVNNPQDVAATVGLGMALAKQFKLDSADEMFNRVLSADPNNALAHAGNAIVQMNRLQSSSGTIRSQRDSILQFA